MDELQVFNFKGNKIRSLIISNEPWFIGKEVAEVLGYCDTNQAIRKHVDDDDKLTRQIDGSGQSRNMTIINESGLYSLILSSKLPEAKEFKKWVTKEVLPTLRKTGTYSIKTINDSYMIEDPIQRAKRWIEEETERQNLRLENKELINEIIHKEDVIGGFVDDIDLTEKRRRITQIIRYGSDKYSERYNLLYREFEMKYKMDLNRRINSDQYKSIKPKIKNKMDLIDRGLHKIPQLYEIACKLFENDVAKLQQEIWNTCERT